MSLSCIDGPALPCNEPGCPAPIINCSFLAANNACELPIEKIWERSAPIAHPMPVWMYCGLSCKQCGSDTLTEADLDRIARHEGPAAPERVWGVAGNQLNSGARHASIYAEMTAARRACDTERLWRPAGGEDSQLNHDYLFHESVRDLDCQKPLPPPKVPSWVQKTRATLSAIRRGVERVAQGKSISKAKLSKASAPGTAAEPTEGDAAPGETPFWLKAIRVQKSMGYSSGSRAFRCAQRVHSGMVLDHPRNLAPSAAPKLLRCTVAARGGAGGAGEPPHNWTFTRAGPFVGYGGYDWHTTLWDDAMGTEVVVDAHGDTGAADVNAWFLGPTSEGGEPLGFPPVHMHHAHIRNGCIATYRKSSYASPKAFGKSAETAREPDEACPSEDWVNATAQRSGALVFESHQDSMCHDDPGSESAPAGSPANGARCYLKVLPAGAAIRVVPPLRLDAQLNDVRPVANAAPLNMYFQVALRWRAAPARPRAPAAAAAAAPAAAADAADATSATPAAPRVAAAALVTVGNPGSEATRTSSKDSQKPEYSALTGVLRLMLARGSRNVPTLYYAGFTLPLAIANSAKPLEVHSMFVHWHQRIASAVFCLAAMPSQLGLPPLLLPHSPLQLPNTNGTAYASMVRRLLSHPALRCASVPSSGLQFVPARPGASAAGWYDRRPNVYCVDGWQLRPGENLTFVWLDERHANPYAAVAGAAASSTWAPLPRDGFTVEGGDAASAAARAEQLQGAGPAYESTMSGVIGPPTVVPQHYIARLLLIANHEDPPASPAAAAADAAAAAEAAAVAVVTGAPGRSAGPLQCCCIPAVQLIRNSASNPRLAELRTMYEDVGDPSRTKMKNAILQRTPAPGNTTDGAELWRWGWRSGTTRNLNHDDIHCGGWAANVNCG